MGLRDEFLDVPRRSAAHATGDLPFLGIEIRVLDSRTFFRIQ
jgi:hypothetical protein